MFKRFEDGTYYVSEWKEMGSRISPNDFIVVGMPQQIRNEIEALEKDLEYFGSNPYHIYSSFLDELMGARVQLDPFCKDGKLVSFRVSMEVFCDEIDCVEEYEFGWFDLSKPVNLSDLPERYFESFSLRNETH